MTKLTFELDSDIQIVIDTSGIGVEWTAKQPKECLLITSGRVTEKSGPDSLICHSGPPTNSEVVTLEEASLESNVGDSGPAIGHLTNCTITEWYLANKT